MAIQFDTSFVNLLASRGILAGVFGGVSNRSTPTHSATIAVTVWAGSQPTPATISANWTSYNTSYLAHWTGVTYQYLELTPRGVGLITQNNASSPLSTPINTGTAAWGIMWGSNVANGSSSGQIGGTTLPNTRFVVVPVTVTGGNGAITLSSISIATGVSHALTSSSLNLFQ